MHKSIELKAPHRDLRQTIDDAFMVMGRRLEDFARRQRGDVKRHERRPRARVKRILQAISCGFLETAGGRSLYFHKNSVANNAFGKLAVGSTVSFLEEPGANGPQ